MLNNSPEIFTDRREAISLFEHVRSRDPEKPWMLLPILAFIAPPGSGKSTLIEYLRAQKCCLPDNRAAVPYTHLDFTLADAPKDPLSIFVALRNQLQGHLDGQGKHLLFPRFDLGASIALAMQTDALPLFNESEIEDALSRGLPFFGPAGEMGNAFGNLLPVIPPLIVGLKWLGQIPGVQTLLQRLERGPGWRWYQTHTTDVGLRAGAGVKDVLLRLYALSMPGQPGMQGRKHLIEHILPSAFLSDLRDALDSPGPLYAWSKTTSVVLFLDGFDALLSEEYSENIGIRLLEMLALSEHRKRGEADPLLLVIGSRQRLLEHTEVDQHPPFEVRTASGDERSAQEYTRTLYEGWRRQLPQTWRFLRLSDLYLPVWLSDFGQEDTMAYLSLLGEREQTHVFAENALVEAIYRVTKGHPLFIALAAAAVLEADARSRKLGLQEIEQAVVSPEVAPGHEDESIAQYLLFLFLRQLSAAEQKELVFCAAARTLDVATIQAVLQLPEEIDARRRWNRYRRFTFVRAIDSERIVLHPIVRELLLRELSPNHEVESDYYKTHLLLQTLFQKRALQGDERAQIEEVFHALALGDPEPAIEVALSAQRSNLPQWIPLLEAVAQAPTGLMPEETKQRALEMMKQAILHHRMQESVSAIVLYTWLLTKAPRDSQEAAAITVNLGVAYNTLSGRDRQTNLERAIACYNEALQMYTRQTFPMEWATIQHNLGSAYSDLPQGVRQANLEKALVCYKAALEVCTKETYPDKWAGTMQNLGSAYMRLPQGDQQANLEKAIACYEAALEVYTKEAFPSDWARIQNNLGSAYSNVPKGDIQSHRERAIACYEAALQIHTKEAFPSDWAALQGNLGSVYSSLSKGNQQTNLEQAISYFQAAQQIYTFQDFPLFWAKMQHNLGSAYSDLPQGDRQTNLEQALACYEAASQVHTREGFPTDWAMLQSDLGKLFLALPGGNRQANLKQAISYCENALQIYTREEFPTDWARAQNTLGIAYSELQEGDRQANLKKAIACYEAALQVYTRENFPVDWATEQHNLGTAYSALPALDQQTNLEKAITHYEAALQVYTRENFPSMWAKTQNDLGATYHELPQEDRQANLEKALSCYQQALEVYTLKTDPVEWARTQSNLGNAYTNLPKGDRLANLKQAITCFQNALQIFTRHSFATDWAKVHLNLGIAYSAWPEGKDRQANLEKAIVCYQNALQVCTRETFPLEWAGIQDNLGSAYRGLLHGDGQNNLQKAIAAHQEALQVYTREEFPVRWAMVQHNLGAAYSDLLEGDRKQIKRQLLRTMRPLCKYIPTKRSLTSGD